MKQLTKLVVVAVAGVGLLFALAAVGEATHVSKHFSALSGDANWLVAHFDNRDGVFDDGGDVKLTGHMFGRKITVEASAAWDWNVYTDPHPSALVYNTAKTMPQLHQHAGCRTGDAGEDHTFTATVTISIKGGTISGDVLGGANNERLSFSAAGHVPNCADIGGTAIGGSPPAYDGTHTETENEVLVNFKITGGTGKFAGAAGRGVLQFVYNTAEPHELLEAFLTVNLDTHHL